MTNTTNLLNKELIAFLNVLHSTFEKRRQYLLQQRSKPALLDFDPETQYIRDDDWKCEPTYYFSLVTRTIEITGPAVPKKMVVRAMDSGADQYMIDFEDSLSPTWENVLEGHINAQETISANWKALGKFTNIHVRPRGLHLNEKNFFNMSAALFDFGVNFAGTIYHHQANGTLPCYYLPKLEHHLEALWWADVFRFSETYFKVALGTIKCTVLVETLPLVFQMDEVLFQLKNYATALNCGRWDYIFSMIKNRPNNLFPNRSTIGMTQDCMMSYANLLVDTCRKRGVQAIGGMAAQIPNRHNETLNETALQKVRKDKELEKVRGFDGTWVGHPDLVSIVRDIFKKTKSYDISQFDQETAKIQLAAYRKALMTMPYGRVTAEELKNNLYVSLIYAVNWLSGKGCVAINGLMEDMATAEVARTQVSNWIKHKEFALNEVKQMLHDIAVSVEEEEKYEHFILWQAETLLEEVFNQCQHGKYVEFLSVYLYDFLEAKY